MIILHQKNVIPEPFLNGNGIATWSELNSGGFNQKLVESWLINGETQRIKRGVYRWLDQTFTDCDEWLAITTSIKNCVICLVSALSYYNLTTIQPALVHIAIPIGKSSLPIINFPPIKIWHLKASSFEIGINTLTFGVKLIRISTPERAICEAFKFRNKIGIDIAIEALKTYLKHAKQNLSLLDACAKLLSVKNIIRPYLEALL